MGEDSLTTTGGLSERDESGLTLLQRKTLGSLAICPSPRDALAEAGITSNQLTYWLRHDKAFRKHYDDLYTDAVEAGRSILSTLLPKAAETLGDALDADQAVHTDVTCPHCEKSFKVSIQAPHWATRMRASEDILKREGELAETVKHGGVIGHVHLLPDQLARLAIEAGQDVPPSVVEDLKRRGLVPSTPSTSTPDPPGQPPPGHTDTSETEVVDAEVREVPGDEPSLPA